MRENKPFTFISYKKEESVLHFHCSTPGHESVRLVEIAGKGHWCPIGCGPTIPAMRIKQTDN